MDLAVCPVMLNCLYFNPFYPGYDSSRSYPFYPEYDSSRSSSSRGKSLLLASRDLIGRSVYK